MNYYKNYFNNIYEQLNSMDEQEFIAIASIMEQCNQKGGKVIFVGNGGSAALSSHLSVDLTKAAGIRSTNFNEADLITCYANDYGYEKWVVEALKSYVDLNDVVVLISSSGRSPNIIMAAEYLKLNGIKLITLSGFSSQNELRNKGDINLWVDSSSYNIVEMTHHIWLLSIVDYIISKNRNL